MSLTYFLNDLEMVPVAPIITVITLVFTFHMRCISSINFQGKTLLRGDSHSLRKCQGDETWRIVDFRNPHVYVTVFSQYLTFNSPRLM
jgi:hypothetical protein